MHLDSNDFDDAVREDYRCDYDSLAAEQQQEVVYQTPEGCEILYGRIADHDISSNEEIQDSEDEADVDPLSVAPVRRRFRYTCLREYGGFRTDYRLALVDCFKKNGHPVSGQVVSGCDFYLVSNSHVPWPFVCTTAFKLGLDVSRIFE